MIERCERYPHSQCLAQSFSELRNELRASIEDNRFRKVMKSKNVKQKQLRELLGESDIAAENQMTHLR
jgi:hypothetical protein